MLEDQRNMARTILVETERAITTEVSGKDFMAREILCLTAKKN
jgi:hypothetical protein